MKIADEWKEMESRKFTIPSLPPSVNRMYTIIRIPNQPLRVELTNEVRVWKTKAKEFVPRLTPHSDSYLFQLDAHFTYNYLFKNGNFRKFDTANMLKVLIDAVCEKVGIRDEYVKHGRWDSTHSEDREFVDCTLTQLAWAKGDSGKEQVK